MPDGDSADPSTREPSASVQASVEMWTKRVRDAKRKFSEDFDRLRENMEFVCGLQWPMQEHVDTDRYTNNMVLRVMKQKLSSLYARNPTAVAERRERMDFALWDEQMESLTHAVQSAMTNPLDFEAQALLADYMHGRQWQAMIDKIAKSLKIVYQWQVDHQEPEFKLQMKQLVQRAITTGVAYVRLSFVRDDDTLITTSSLRNTMDDRARQVEELMQRVDSWDVNERSSDTEQLSMLANSLAYSQSDGEQDDINERLVFDFPPVTSIIVDPCCRSLKGFVGAQWIAQEYVLPLNEVNAYFETQIKPGGDLVTYNSNNHREGVVVFDGSNGSMTDEDNPYVAVWEIIDKRTKSHLFVCNGSKDYLQAPEPLHPCVSRFWPILTLLFNDVEVESECKATIYPPSDVQLMKHVQKEWNRSRDALREHRKQNHPKYVTGAGWLTEQDKKMLQNAPQSGIIELQGVPPGTDIGKMLAPLMHAPIDPALYDTAALQQDMLLSVGMQEANVGPTSGSTATESTIAEQSRLSTASSNVDDLDDLLSDLAKAGGEMLLKEMSEENAKRIAGVGAVWPTTNRKDFLNEVYLKIMAASSGRPNQAIESANFQRLAPLLLQAGASPKFLVEEGVKRLDDRLDVSKAFPLNLNPLGGPGMLQPGGMPSAPAEGGQPPQQLQNQAAVSLPGQTQ